MVNPDSVSPAKPMFAQASKDHAVVIGASIAGLLAARVLSDYFRRVTLIERDRLPTDSENRKGVPQGRHLHLLQVKGEQIMRQLFPGLDVDLAEAGAVRVDLCNDLLWYQYGGYKIRHSSDIRSLCMSRPLLEFCVRRRVLAIKNLTCLEQCSVRSLVVNESRSQVIGVNIRRQTEGSPEEILEADLVVDASGRSSKTPQWLEMLGYAQPAETAIKIGISYTTCLYRQNFESLPNAKAIYIPPVPPVGKRGGGLFPIEGNRWIVTLAGWLGDHAPADKQGFLDFAKSLASQDIYNAISRAEPLTDFTTHKFPSSLRRHYERMEHFPEGYLVMGDAICSFNPVYAQGMSVSAMEAEVLNQCLEEANRRNTWRSFAQNFFKRAAEVISNPWVIAVGEDFHFPEVEGVKPVGTDLINWYMVNLKKATLHDPGVSRAFFQVITMTHSPKSLLSPKIVLRVVKDRLIFRHSKVA